MIIVPNVLVISRYIREITYAQKCITSVINFPTQTVIPFRCSESVKSYFCKVCLLSTTEHYVTSAGTTQVRTSKHYLRKVRLDFSFSSCICCKYQGYEFGLAPQRFPPLTEVLNLRKH